MNNMHLGKVFRKIGFPVSFIMILFLTNCFGDEVKKENLCGQDLEIKKYDCNAGTCYFVEAPDDIDFEFEVKITFESKSGGETKTHTYSSTSLVIGYVLPAGIWEQNFGYNTTTTSLSGGSEEYQETIHYNTTLYEYPNFEIKLLGDCPEETKEVDGDEVTEGTVVYLPSFLATQPVDAGQSFDIYLFSNNPKELITLSITSSLGETESLKLVRTGETNFYSGTIYTELGNTSGTDNDGTLIAENGTTFTITYNDALDADNNTTSISHIVTVEGDTAPTCSDGIQNGDEEDVDCGGTSCTACPTCTDGIQNGDETGVDCGGPDCDACPTCSDGIQNGDEEGVDCGGTNCSACEQSDVSFEGSGYAITDASYLDYSSEGNQYVLFTISTYENESQVFSMDIELVSSSTISSNTYEFGDADFGVTGSVAIDNVADYATVNGGSVVLVLTPLGDYALDFDLQTTKGTLTGSYTVSGGF